MHKILRPNLVQKKEPERLLFDCELPKNYAIPRSLSPCIKQIIDCATRDCE